MAARVQSAVITQAACRRLLGATVRRRELEVRQDILIHSGSFLNGASVEASVSSDLFLRSRFGESRFDHLVGDPILFPSENVLRG